MRTLRSAAARLAAVGGVADLVPVVTELGFVASPVPLDRDARDSLGLPPQVAAASITPGAGALRALLIEVDQATPLRDAMARVAARLSTRTPHLLWLLAGTTRDATQIGVAVWRPGVHGSPRVAALIADRQRIVDSDAETLLSLASALDGSDALTYTRWVEILGRDALSKRFYRELERRVGVLAESGAVTAGSRVAAEERSELALLYTSRLLFLAFLQAKGWLDGDRAFLEHHFDACMASGGAFHRRVLRPLFFGTLNTKPPARSPVARAFGRIPFLNGGLFARSAAERRGRTIVFDDAAFGALFAELLSRYRFTAREDRGTWSEAAIDPEMLGRAFESLMATRTRRDTGAFFTPQHLVEHVTELALKELLPCDGAPSLEALRRIAILDPACGSGAFLVHALERLADMTRLAGDVRSIATIRREILTRSIFGVDRNPTAVWLCELRLWLSVVIESDETDPLRVSTLPNLDRNVRAGDSLSGNVDWGDAGGRGLSGDTGKLTVLRHRYARASGPRKVALGRTLDREERRLAVARIDADLLRLHHTRRERAIAHRARDLFGERHRPDGGERTVTSELRARAAELRRERARLLTGGALPFSFAVHFADVAARGGFDLVLGNPPWIRLHRIPVAARAELRRRFTVFGAGGWENGAVAAHAGRGFAAQVDLAALFTERALQLLSPTGTLALLLPSKLWRSLAGGGVRQLLAREADLVAIEDWSDARAAFDAAVYPSIVIARRRESAPVAECPRTRPVTVTLQMRERAIAWSTSSVALDASPGSPWILLPPDARVAFERLRSAGVPLAESPLGRPHLGVKCGCNDVFIVTAIPWQDAAVGSVRVAGADARVGCIESALLRPVLRGEDVRPWAAESRDCIIWTHDANGDPLKKLPLHAGRWLAPWRRRLDARADARGRAAWWTLFRTEAAETSMARVVWADLAQAPRAIVLPPGDTTVPLNSCYVVRCPTIDDAFALAAILNGPLAAAWLDPLAEPARGSYRRYLGWTTALLPLPRDWPRARGLLAPLGARAMGGRIPSDGELATVTLDAFRVTAADVAPLLTWKKQ